MSGSCGTYAGWQAHIRRNEQPCRECRQANTDYKAWFRFRTGGQRHPRTCPECGSVFKAHRCAGVPR